MQCVQNQRLQERVKQNVAREAEKASEQQERMEERVKQSCAQLKEKMLVQCVLKQQVQVDVLQCGQHWCEGVVQGIEKRWKELQDQ